MHPVINKLPHCVRLFPTNINKLTNKKHVVQHSYFIYLCFMSQGWKLDTIDFFSYGVLVRKSSGLLDMPAMIDTSHNWLDEDGNDYWQTIGNTRYDDKTISLSCFIEADSYSNFKSQLQSFYDALLAANKRQLTAPYLSSDIECYIEREIKVSESNYVRSAQIGIFTLRLTVAGDNKFNLINISRVFSYNVVAVAKASNLKVTKNLQGDFILTMTFESNEILDIQKDDYVQYEYHGLGQDRFLINSEPTFIKKSTNKYVYNLSFDFFVIILDRSQFLLNGESDFSFYGNMEDIVDLIITNHGRTGFNKFLKGTVATTIAKNHNFSSEDCLSVLKRISAEYGLEYEFPKQDPDWWNYYIDVKEEVANDVPVTLQYGKGNGSYELSRGRRIENEFFTKLYAYGAAKNLPYDYRSGLRRLSFDANPLEQNVSLYGYKEKTLYFDDIFPARTANVTGYFQVLKADLIPEQAQVWPNGIYRIEDTALDFNINDYLLPGAVAKIVMKTGNLAGYEFDIVKYEDADKYIYISPFNDAGLILPNATTQIAIGDQYTLVNIDQPASYITVAENALQAAAVDALADGSTPKFEYVAKLDPKFIIDNSLFFEAGDRLTLIDTDFNINGEFRISSLTYSDFIGTYELRFSDHTFPSRLTVVEKQVEDQARTNESTGADTVENIRDSQQTVGDLYRRLLNILDNKLNTDDIVRNNSLDPGMISLDGGYIQASLKGAVITGNVDGNEDKLSIEPGEFTLKNVNTLSRYDIAQLKAGGGTYDPTRSWNLPATDYTVPDKNRRELYVKLNISNGSTAAEFVFSETHIETKLESGFLYYNLGTIEGGTE